APNTEGSFRGRIWPRNLAMPSALPARWIWCRQIPRRPPRRLLGLTHAKIADSGDFGDELASNSGVEVCGPMSSHWLIRLFLVSVLVTGGAFAQTPAKPASGAARVEPGDPARQGEQGSPKNAGESPSSTQTKPEDAKPQSDQPG